MLNIPRIPTHIFEGAIKGKILVVQFLKRVHENTKTLTATHFESTMYA